MDEHVVLVDEHDSVLGIAPKLESHHADTPLHRGFSAFVFDGEGRLLLQQRSGAKRTWPLAWSNSCCGHPMLHEGPLEAGRRRLAQELGLCGVELEVVLPFYRYRCERDGVTENELCPVMVGFTDSQPVPDAREVAAVRWIAWDEFLAWTEVGTGLSPWCVEEARLLERDRRFRSLMRRSGTRPAGAR